MARCLARIWISAAEKAEAIAAALEPDNKQAPRDVVVECESRDGVTACHVEVECSGPSSILRLRNTVDDLISNARAALDALQAVDGEL